MRLQDNTPEIYYNHSRDFQFIGRLYDVVLNSIKTDIDTIKYIRLGLNTDEQLLGLLATTLGFQAKHNYNNKQLAAICSTLPLILRNKGSNKAIELAVNAILNAEGINDYSEISLSSDGILTVHVPEQIGDLTLLKDLADYIIPAGISLRLVKEIKEVRSIKSEFVIKNSVYAYAITENSVFDTSRIVKAETLPSDDEHSYIANKPSIQNMRIIGAITKNTTTDTEEEED